MKIFTINSGKIVSAALLLAVLYGCTFFAPHRQTAYFDLRQLQPQNTSLPGIGQIVFDNNTGGSQKMLIRLNDWRLQEDPFNKWIQSPGDLLGRYMNIYLHTSGGKSRFLVEGTIEIFEVDMVRHCFVLAGHYKIIDLNLPVKGTGIYSYYYTSDFQAESAESFAAAASNCAEQLAKEIRATLEKQISIEE